MAEPDKLAPLLEPIAVEALGTRNDTVLLASIAVSLKRLADVADAVCDPAYDMAAIRTRAG